jgi:hypothetical protein
VQQGGGDTAWWLDRHNFICCELKPVHLTGTCVCVADRGGCVCKEGVNSSSYYYRQPYIRTKTNIPLSLQRISGPLLLGWCCLCLPMWVMRCCCCCCWW